MFRYDTLKSILLISPENILGEKRQDIQELQPRMTYRIAKDAPRAWKEDLEISWRQTAFQVHMEISKFLNEIEKDVQIQKYGPVLQIHQNKFRISILLEIYLYQERRRTFFQGNEKEAGKRTPKKICPIDICTRLVSVTQGYFDKDKYIKKN